ncbi:MAG: hypothetical protein U9Q22_00655 [Candidatus Altiarchaeota archaeon]|nr:hypothetical protein [Candidatus Altiarchaeota archaeon]
MPPEQVDNIIGKAVLAAIVIGVIVTLILVTAMREESYSALYIKPDSYTNYIKEDKVSFTYGVQCFENKKTRYDLKIILGETLITKKEFTLEGKGKELVDNISFDIPGDIEFPVKVKLLLTANNMNYSTHYWLKGRG